MKIELGDVYEIKGDEYACFKVLHDGKETYYGMQKFTKPLKTLFVKITNEKEMVIIHNEKDKKHLLTLLVQSNINGD